MQKLIAALALCITGSAQAQLVWGSSEVYDPGTALDWSYLVPANGQTLASTVNRADGRRLATAAEVTTFFHDAGLLSFIGAITPTSPSYPDYPAALTDLFRWGDGVSSRFGTTFTERFYTASNSGVFGTVGDGSLSAASADRTFLVTAGSTDMLYMSTGWATGFSPGFAYVSSVPEPSTWVLTLVGMGCLAWVKKRQKLSYRHR